MAAIRAMRGRGAGARPPRRPPLRGGRPAGRGRGYAGERVLPPRGALIAAFLVVAVLIGLGFLLGAGQPPAVHDVVVIAEKTTRAPGVLASDVRQRIRSLAESGATGQLAVHAVGARDVALPPVGLAVMRDNERESDLTLRAAAINHRLDALSSKLNAEPVGSEGFNLVAALQAAANAASKSDGRVEVWLQTTLLSSSSDPLRMTELTATDPDQAVKEVIRSTKIGTLDLSRVDLHPVLLQPVGDNQAPLTPWDNAWRSAFITDLGSELGAKVFRPIFADSSGPPWSGASTVPPIPAYQERTPRFPTAPEEDPPVVIDTAAFVPNTATLLNAEATQAKVAELVARYQRASGKSTIEVKGFTAAFGDENGARVLSQQRAAILGQLLGRAGVPLADIRTLGVGFGKRADPTQDRQSAAQRVVIIRLLPRT